MIVHTCGGAITVVNAIATGIGGAIGVNANNTVTIKPSDEYQINTKPAENSSSLVDTSVELFTSRYNLKRPLVSISTHSDFPPARGLKTSSAISTLVIKSLSSYFGVSMGNQEIISLAASASKKEGVSITGAIDDAYACYLGGFYLTNNQTNEVILRDEISPSRQVFLLVPKSKLEKSSIGNIEELIDLSAVSQSVTYAKAGKFVQAIRTNSKAYWPVLYPDSEIYFELEDQLQNVIGLNGTGPSLFLLVTEEDFTSDLHLLEGSYSEYDIISTKTRRQEK